MAEKITVPGTKIETEWMEVTPEIAKIFLDVNTANRAKRDKHVFRIASDMEQGMFHITHQGIAFDEDGVMLDGQHRCQAIILSEKPQWMLVTTGLPVKAKKVVDGGAKRKAADFMPGAFRDLKAAAIRIVMGIEYMGGAFSANSLANSVQQVTSAAIQENWDRWGDLTELAHLASQANRNVAIGPAGLLAAAMLHPKTGKEFLTGIVSMTGLEYGDPRLALLKFRNSGKRVQTPYAAFAAIKTAKAFDCGKRMNVLRFGPTEVQKVDLYKMERDE